VAEIKRSFLKGEVIPSAQIKGSGKDNSAATFKHPCFWAPFVYYGN
jgi:hypothetical protein